MQKAIILLSGGLDSTTVAAIAKADGYNLYALTVDYGQRHQAELNAAVSIAKQLAVADHKTIHLDLRTFGGSALTDNLPVPEKTVDEIPITYVPARNTIMLSLALAWAEVINANAIYIGVNAVDYSGYPDCRPAFINAFEQLATLATKTGIEGTQLPIKTPLIHLTKAEIIQLGTKLGIDYSLTVSCYQANEQGEACRKCDACRHRAQGFSVAKLADPTRYMA